MKRISSYLIGLFFAYPKMKKAIDKLEKYIKKKCYASKLDPSPVEDQFNHIAQVINKRYDLIVLKEIADGILNSLPEEERGMLNHYFILGLTMNQPVCLSVFTERVFNERVYQIIDKIPELFKDLDINGLELMCLINETPFVKRYVCID